MKPSPPRPAHAPGPPDGADGTCTTGCRTRTASCTSHNTPAPAAGASSTPADATSHADRNPSPLSLPLRQLGRRQLHAAALAQHLHVPRRQQPADQPTPWTHHRHPSPLRAHHSPAPIMCLCHFTPSFERPVSVLISRVDFPASRSARTCSRIGCAPPDRRSSASPTFRSSPSS